RRREPTAAPEDDLQTIQAALPRGGQTSTLDRPSRDIPDSTGGSAQPDRRSQTGGDERVRPVRAPPAAGARRVLLSRLSDSVGPARPGRSAPADGGSRNAVPLAHPADDPRA